MKKMLLVSAILMSTFAKADYDCTLEIKNTNGEVKTVTMTVGKNSFKSGYLAGISYVNQQNSHNFTEVYVEGSLLGKGSDGAEAYADLTIYRKTFVYLQSTTIDTLEKIPKLIGSGSAGGSYEGNITNLNCVDTED